MAAPVNIEPPVITGVAQVGQTLHLSDGVWDDPAATFEYEWSKGGVPIAGADTNEYVLVTGDIGGIITGTVTATNVDGSTPAVSNATPAVVPPPPVNTTAPSVTGNPYVNATVVCNPGEWTNATTFTYQWYAGTTPASPIIDATDPEYIISPDELGLALACLVTADHASGGVQALSNWTAAVTVRPPTPQEEFAVWLARHSYPKPGPRWHGA